MQGLVQVFRSFGAGRIAAMGVVALALIGFFAFVIIRFTQPAMAPLFTDLSTRDASAVVKELEQQNVPYELRQDGAGILVPKDQVAKLRMRLAEQRLPSGGSVGWEIFDKGDGFSATSFVQNVNHLRALEGEIARSIRALDRVASARVHLVVPERPLFTRDAPQPSASIVIRARGDLGQGEVRAIRHLVASAVQGLKPEKVSLVDEGGRLLADGAEGDETADAATDERGMALEKRLRERVESIVGRVVGSDRARVEVRAEIDRTKSTQTSDKFDPESRVARSTQTREEASQSSEPAEQQVSVANQVPNAAAGQAAQQQGQKENSNKNEEVVNYEISRVTRTETQDGGRVKRLSVAVLVDGVYARAQNGDVTYAPRAQEELDRIGALVRAGVGFDAARGDTVEIVNLRFADLPGQSAEAGGESWFDITKADIMRAIELGVLSLLTVLVLLFVVRPIMRKALNSETGSTPALTASDAIARGGVPNPNGSVTMPDGSIVQAMDESGVPLLGANGVRVLQSDGGPVVVGPDGAARRLAAVEVEGKVKAESLEKIGELVRSNPSESANLIRQWMQEPA